MSRLIRVAFLGTPELARVVLARLADAGDGRWELVGVVAQPDKPAGRNLQSQPPPVKQEALARGLPVLQPLRARDPGFIEAFRQWRPDVAVVAAYGQILPPSLLDVPPMGCWNVHTSLLPRWRGAAPIQWAIAEGDEETGVSLMRMEAGLDTGPVLAVARTRIGESDTGASLHDRLAGMGGDLVVEQLPVLATGQVVPVPQPEVGVTYARKLAREDGKVDWAMPAEVIERRARAFTPWPGSHGTVLEGGGLEGKTLKIHSMGIERGVTGSPGQVVERGREGWVVACGRDGVRLREVQLEGGRRMPGSAFAAGHRLERMG